jgi:hypothetical protein
MSRPPYNYEFFRREVALTGASLGFMLTGLVGIMAGADDLATANALHRHRADVHYTAPNEATIRADYAADAAVAEQRAYSNGLSGLGLLVVGLCVMGDSAARIREKYPPPVLRFYHEVYTTPVPAEQVLHLQ